MILHNISILIILYKLMNLVTERTFILSIRTYRIKGEG